MSPAGVEAATASQRRQPSFHVRLDNFEGPFDLLLQLIGKHQLDVTTVALSRVTDEFIETVIAGGKVWDLDVTSNFLVVAATLLDLKAARLLPSGEVEDPEDLALLEARDLLFARLLQYRAFKLMSAWMAEQFVQESRRFARPGGLEEQFARLIPQVRIALSPEAFAALAARALTPAEPVQVSLTHLHQPQVSVPEQAGIIVERLRRQGSMSFRTLVADADRLTTVGRFLALLELFRNRAVAFEQLTPLGELTVRWTGDDDTDLGFTDEYDHSAEPADDGSRPVGRVGEGRHA